MVWRVGEVLTFQADCGATRIGGSMGSLDACKEVASIELQSGLCGIHFHGTAADRLYESGCKTHLAFLVLVEDIVVVKAAAILDLFVVGIDVLTEGLRFAEIKWCAFYEADLTCGNRCLVNWQ